MQRIRRATFRRRARLDMARASGDACANPGERMNETPEVSYARRLGVWDAMMVVVGGIIGSGIFLTPASIARQTGSSGEQLAAWAVGGVIALIGAPCYAELGTRRPNAGGGYVNLRDAFGLVVAFVYGWNLLVVNH